MVCGNCGVRGVHAMLLAAEERAGDHVTVTDHSTEAQHVQETTFLRKTATLTNVLV